MSEKRTKKLMRKIKIYDLELKKLYIKSAPLRFISNLEGITQYSTQKSLYLCGSNKPALNSSETTGSYLFRYDLADNFKQPSVAPVSQLYGCTNGCTKTKKRLPISQEPHVYWSHL